MEIKRICVYCASSTQISHSYFEAAYELGQRMARLGIGLVNGAGNMGLMQASADGCLHAGGEAVGVIPVFMVEEGWCHQGMTRIVTTPDMHARQQEMARLSDAAIVLPGGCGTMAELMELVTWKQLGLYLKPIVILNVNGYFDPLLQQLERCVEGHFMRPQHRGCWCMASDAAHAVRLCEETPLWDVSVRRFAAL